ncbi:MAG: hypothetical protein KY461_14320, partial [Actinobacteria bacterium]|nr:hypothetical protein [Actinomycetota bacterium]
MSTILSRLAGVTQRRVRRDRPAGLLHRVRSQFLVLALVVSIISLLDIARIDTMVSTPGYLATLGGYLVWVLALYRFGERWTWLDLGGPVAVVSLGIVAGSYDWAFAILYGALFVHGTFGGPWRAARNALAYMVAYEVAAVVTRGAEYSASGIASHVIGVAVVAYLVRTITSSVRRHDATREREQILTRAGGELLTAATPDEVAHTALAAVVAVVGGGESSYRVSLWRQHQEELEMLALAGLDLTTFRVPLAALPEDLVAAYHSGQVVRLGPARMLDLQVGMGIAPDFDHGLSVPLVDGGELNGLMFVATHEPLDADAMVALERFMHEVSLADVLVRRQTLLRGVVGNSADGILLLGRDGVIEFA